MFINHVFPRELLAGNIRVWNGTFITINEIGNNKFKIEEVEQKPAGSHALNILMRLEQIVTEAHHDLNKCSINVRCLNSSPENATRTFESLEKASLVVNQAVRRISLGYDHAYLTRSSLFVRIRDAIYLIFGWQTERDKIHSLCINIFKILHLANNGLVPYSRKALSSDRDFLMKQIEKLHGQA